MAMFNSYFTFPEGLNNYKPCIYDVQYVIIYVWIRKYQQGVVIVHITGKTRGTHLYIRSYETW